MAVILRSIVAMFLAIAGAAAQVIDDEGRWHSGAYSYSDELGGFRILSVTGIGTKDDPVEIAQEFLSASPVTLVIRAVRPIRVHERVGEFATGMLHMRIVAVNNSGLPWLEFEFELQEHLGEPSGFSDGLSFDQRRTDSQNIASDRFAAYSRDFEPYDRLLFRDGHVDPLETAVFEFFVTDFTPRSQFFLKQDPMVPFS